MSRNNGLFNLDGNLEVRIARPLDARFLTKKKVDLIDPDNWKSTDERAYTYKGMIVSVIDDTNSNNGIYRLKDDDYTVSSNWEKVEGSGETHILEDWEDNNSYGEKELVKYKDEILQSLENDNEDAPTVIGFKESENWRKNASHINKVFILDWDNLHDITFDDLKIWKGATIHKVNVQSNGYNYIELPSGVYLEQGEPYMIIYQRVDDIDMGGDPIDIGKIKTGYISYNNIGWELEPGDEIEIIDDIFNDNRIITGFIMIEDYDKFIENFIEEDIMPGWTELALNHGLLVSDEDTVYDFIKAPFVNPFELGEIDIPSDKWLNLNNTRIKGFEERVYNKHEVVCENKIIYRSKIDNNTSNPTDGYSVSNNWEEFTTEVKYGFYNIGEDQHNPGNPDPNMLHFKDIDGTTLDNWEAVQVLNQQMEFVTSIDLKEDDYFYLVLEYFYINYPKWPFIKAYSGILLKATSDINQGETVTITVNAEMTMDLTVFSNNNKELVNYLIWHGDDVCDLLQNSGMNNLITNEPTINKMFKMVDCSIEDYILTDEPGVSSNWEIISGRDSKDDEDTSPEFGTIEIDYNDVITYVNQKKFNPGKKYKINNVNKKLYGGTTAILKALSTSQLEEDGVGIFYNPTNTYSTNYVTDYKWHLPDAEQDSPSQYWPDPNAIYYWGGYYWECIEYTGNVVSGYFDIEIEAMASTEDVLNAPLTLFPKDVLMEYLVIDDTVSPTHDLANALKPEYNTLVFTLEDGHVITLDEHDFEYYLDDVPLDYDPNETDMDSYRYKVVRMQIIDKVIDYVVNTLGYKKYHDYTKPNPNDPNEEIIDNEKFYEDIAKGERIILYPQDEKDFVDLSQLFMLVNGSISVGYEKDVQWKYIVNQNELQPKYFKKLDWNAKNYGGDNLYKKVFNKIKYNLQNDLIYYRNEADANIVEFTPEQKMVVLDRNNNSVYRNPISGFLWGQHYLFSLFIDPLNKNIEFDNINAIHGCHIKNSYCETINFHGYYNDFALINLKMENSLFYNNLSFYSHPDTNNFTFYNITMENSEISNSIINNGFVFHNVKFTNSAILDSSLEGREPKQIDWMTFERFVEMENVVFENSLLFGMELNEVQYHNVHFVNSLQKYSKFNKGFIDTGSPLIDYWIYPEYKNVTMINSKELHLNVEGIKIENVVYNNSNIDYVRALRKSENGAIIEFRDIIFDNCKNNVDMLYPFSEVPASTPNLSDTTYSKHVISRSDGELRIKYIDDTDNLIIDSL